MALPEKIINSPTPGKREALTTLSAELTAIATEMKWTLAPTPAFHGAGQFRVVIDNEIILCEGGESTTVKILERGAENTTAVKHEPAATVWGLLTAGALKVSHVKSTNRLHPLA